MIQRETVDARRHSTGRIGFNNGSPIHSRYLKDPTGSCHNICKYGTRFAVEETSPRSPLSRKGRPPLPQGQKSRSINNKSFPESGNFNTNDSAVKLTSSQRGSQHLEKAQNTSVKKKKKSKSSLQPPDLEPLQGQTLEKIESNPEDKEMELSPELSARGHVDPVMRIAPISDKGQSSEVAESDSKERHETSEINPKPNLDANDHDLVEIPPLQAEGQGLDNARYNLAVGEKISEISLQNSGNQEPEGHVVTDVTSAEGSDHILEKGGAGLAEINRIPESSLRFAASKVEEQDGPLNIKLAPAKGTEQHSEKTITVKEKRNKKVEYRVKSSPRAKNYKPVSFGALKHSADAKVKLQWRPSYHSEISQSKEVGSSSRNSTRVSCYKSKGETTVSNEMKNSWEVKKRNAALSSRESHKDHKIVNKPESGLEDTRRLKKVRGVLLSKNQQNVRKNEFEQVRIEASIPNGAKSMKLTSNRLPTSYTQKYSSRRRNRIQSSEFPSPLSLSAVRKGLKRTQSKIDIVQPSPLLLHLPSESGSPKSLDSRALSEHAEPDDGKRTASSRMVYMRKPARDGMNSFKDKQLVAKRLKFKKGRVFELEAQDLTPRRFTFRRRMPIDNTNGNNQNDNVGERNINWVDLGQRLKFRQRMHVVENNKNGDNQNAKETDGDRDDVADSESDVVSQRHLNVKGKVDENKDMRSLFNNVIEETASKLVETRRSKVKALVGAFETVISLQDTNSS